MNVPKTKVERITKFLQLEHYLHLPMLEPAVLPKVSCDESGMDPSLHKLKLYVILPGRISKHH